MLEPQNPGFTGTVWEARPPEQLARDLVTGAGAVPAAEAGLAWARLGASFAAAAVEYDRILTTLGTAWESSNSGPAIERFRLLRDWLTSSAAAAAGNATQAESHAVAYEIARLAMPDAQETEALRDLQKLMEQVGTALGAPMLAKISQVEGDADAAKAVAARVMRTYEAATETLATPWEHEAPPVVVPEVAAGGTESGATEAGQSMPQSPGAVPGYPIAPISIAPVKTDYRGRATTPVTVTQTERTQVQPVSTIQHSTAMPLAPAAMAAGAGQSEEEHTTRSDLAGMPAGDTDLGLNAGVQVAPAVLGGLDPNAQRAVPDIAFNAGSSGAESAKPTESGRSEEASS
ncbi:PPE domain-containing protein [Nocardia sp. CC201C]|uniref:PPE domain-containing protein n=1 Tax=Nocardia sp. CC201C TaxID=3044575 RepID=UPI0024A92C19|nr:PPE domain-containing protein [Nocardia sp. CC201C]